MNIIPRKNRVLAEPILEDKKTASGIIIPETASKEKPMIAKVISVGGGEEVKDINKDDKIFYAKYSGVEIKHDGHEYLVLNSDDILGIIR